MITRKIAPAYYIYIFFSGLIILGLIGFQQIMQQPWLGLSFSSTADQAEGLLVSNVAKHGPAASLVKQGDRVVSIQGEQYSQRLSPQILAKPTVFPTHQAFNDYLERQDRIYTLLLEKQLKLVFDDGRTATITPQPYIPIKYIPPIYFGYLVAGVLCISIGFLVWRYRPQLMVTRLVFTGSIGVLLFYSMLFLLYKELALPGDRLYWLANIELVGVNLFLFTSLAVFMIYPIRLFRKSHIYLLFAFYALISISNSFQIVNFPFHTNFGPFFFAGIFTVYIHWAQWRATRGYPAERAVLKLFLLVMVMPTMLIFAFSTVPRIFFHSDIIPLEIARFVFLPIMLAWALAVIRYRLFDVSLWWFRSVLWLGGGLLVFVLDLLFIYLLNLTPVSALSASLLLAGFMYFPLRQLLLNRFLTPSSDSINTSIALLRNATSDEQFEKAWQQILLDRYDPIKFETRDEKIQTVELRDEGLMLAVPDVVSPRTYFLFGKKQGNSLFNQKDVQTSVSLFSLSQAVLTASKTREEAIINERTRIMRDLHDSLGAKLLSMVHRYRGQDKMQDAREALQLLRDTVHLSVGAGPQDLAELLPEWRIETKERLQIDNIHLQWEEKRLNSPELIASEPLLLLCSILRESINNALKHAQPSRIFVTFERNSNELHLRVGNDGVADIPDSWKFGFGLNHLRTRLERLGGRLLLSSNVGEDYQFVELCAVLPAPG